MMMRYSEFINKNVKVITMIFYKNGRKIKIDYIGILIEETIDKIVILENDGNEESVEKRFVKRVERIYE